ncbi:helix-turn-helix domain-containing protein [Nostoc sp. DSM 114161]|jgi:transcriptional regulator with XRE-family HTH domain|uniref:helix-turn-helix domain-containing protein n=1 Tax=Nostoc sp. DSM 114161 TaxID=3440143 RepID=UPI0040467547
MDEQARERTAEIVRRIKGRRTLAQFAKALGVSPGTVRNWEDCVSSPGLDGLIAIAEDSKQPLIEILAEILGEDLFRRPQPEVAEEVLLQANLLNKKERLRLIQLLAADLVDVLED